MLDWLTSISALRSHNVDVIVTLIGHGGIVEHDDAMRVLLRILGHAIVRNTCMRRNAFTMHGEAMSYLGV